MNKIHESIAFMKYFDILGLRRLGPMKAINTGQIIDAICSQLGSSQRMVANLLNLEPHTLSKNREKLLEDLTPRTGTRLSALFYLIVRKFVLLRSDAIIEILQSHVFPDIHGRMDSVISALQQDKYPLETLTHIAELSQKRYEEKLLKDTIKIPNDSTPLSA